MKKPNFKSKTTKLKDAILTQDHPSDAAKYDDSIKYLINYAQQEYSVDVYLGQEIQEGKVMDLELLTKPRKENNKSDTEFDMDVLEWK